MDYLYSDLPSWALYVVAALGIITTIAWALGVAIRSIAWVIRGLEVLLRAGIGLRDAWRELHSHAAPGPAQSLKRSNS